MQQNTTSHFGSAEFTPGVKYSSKIKVDPHDKGIQGASWVDVKNSVHSTRTQIFSIGEFFEILVFVIHNAFVINGGIICVKYAGYPWVLIVHHC